VISRVAEATGSAESRCVNSTANKPPHRDFSTLGYCIHILSGSGMSRPIVW
jgi:hypothetical protein